MNENSDLLDLHRELIKSLSTKLNSIKYALMTISVSRQFPDVGQAIEFLETNSKLLDGKRDAQFLFKVAIAEKHLDQGQHHDCFEILCQV